MDDNYVTQLAQILFKAHRRIDAETGEAIDIGDEVQKLRNICDRLQVDSETLKHVSEHSQRVPEKISDYGHRDYGEVWGYYMEGWNDCIDEMLAAVPKQSKPVPEGYVLVPERLIEPGDREGASLTRIGFRDGWNACRAEMLASAPKPGGDQ